MFGSTHVLHEVSTSFASTAHAEQLGLNVLHVMHFACLVEYVIPDMHEH